MDDSGTDISAQQRLSSLRLKKDKARSGINFLVKTPGEAGNAAELSASLAGGLYGTNITGGSMAVSAAGFTGIVSLSLGLL
jgi:hypothetical protein